jgi:hypothetical protein
VDSAAVSGSHGALHWILCWFSLAALRCNIARIFNLKRNAAPAPAATWEHDTCELFEL